MEENKYDSSAKFLGVFDFFFNSFFFTRNEGGGDQLIIIEEKISKVNGELAVKRYSKGKMLGKGGFAKVYEVTNLETKKTLAGKIIAKTSLQKTRARQKVFFFFFFFSEFFMVFQNF